MEELDTSMIPEWCTALTSFQQVLEDRRINSTTLMVTNQVIQQESVPSNLHKFTSNPPPLPPNPVLLFQLS